MKRLLPSFLILAITVLPCGCGSKKESKEEPKTKEQTVRLKEESKKLIDLSIGDVVEAPFESSIEVLGEIAQETEKTIHITSLEVGVLKAYLKEVGEIVEKGTPLCEVTTKTGQVIQITSPQHGLILVRYVKEGDPVDSVTSIMTVANADEIRASFNVYEKDISKVRLKQKVIVKSVAYPDKEFNGEIVFIAPNVDEATRSIKIRVNIDNKADLLKFGMFVTGDIIELSEKPVLLLPSEAVVTIDDKPAVFVSVSPEEFTAVPVKLGRRGKLIEILEGLKKGDKIVVRGSFQLKSELLKSTFGED